jgi:hypothetical protein
LNRQAGDVAAWPRQGHDEAAADRVSRYREDDWDDACRLLYRGDGNSLRENDIDFQLDKLGRNLGVTFVASLRPAILDRDGAAFDPTAFAQLLCKGGDP